MAETPLAWLAMAGPTASGKTALALALARLWPVEIISVDSALVYRGMDIGTAKPTTDEQAQVPHHLIDIREPDQPYSAAEFVRDAQILIPQIQSRGRLPLLVGGTMLYFKALFEGLDELPAAQPNLRTELEKQAQEKGWPALHAELAKVDPVTAQRLAPMDAQRISRALEVFLSTGQPLSAFHRKNDSGTAACGPLTILNQPGVLLSLEPQNRARLHQRIEQRFEAMLDAGLLREVAQLRARGNLHPALPAMRCVGYRQTWEALEDAAVSGRASLTLHEWQALRDKGIFATRQLAKRQLTWLRSMPLREVLPCDDPIAIAQAPASLCHRIAKHADAKLPTHC
jgi:tRNA dimethylallyltransferase